jgi:hypothetical protein
MPDFLERAVTGRAKCRGCGRTIEKDDLRFGEALPNPYREGEAVYWFHLPCAACMRPEKTRELLRSRPDDLPDRAWLERTAERGVEHPKLAQLARAERSPSGRARCQQCHEVVDKGDWRLALHVFQEGRMSSIGSIHVGCAEAYFGTRDVLDRARRLSPELTDSDGDEIARQLAEPLHAPIAKTRGEDEGRESDEQAHRTAG